MKPKPRPEANQLDLFQAQFDLLLDLNHPLCVVARKIDWRQFDVAFALLLPGYGCSGEGYSADGGAALFSIG